MSSRKLPSSSRHLFHRCESALAHELLSRAEVCMESGLVSPCKQRVALSEPAGNIPSTLRSTYFK